MTNLDSILKSRDITWPTKVRLVKAMVFPLVMYDFFFDFFCDLLIIQQRVVQPPYVGFFNSFSPVIEI